MNRGRGLEEEEEERRRGEFERQSEKETERQTKRHIRYETLFVSANLCRISWQTFGRRTRVVSARDTVKNTWSPLFIMIILNFR